jgi:zinc transporter 2
MPGELLLSAPAPPSLDSPHDGSPVAGPHNTTEHTGHHHHKKTKDTGNINVRAAYIHALGDLVQNIGVMIAGALIWWQSNHKGNHQWQLADPACTFFFSLLVLYTTYRILLVSVMVLLEGTPEGVSFQTVIDDLVGLDGVEEVHDLHIWSLTPGTPALTVHLRVSATADSNEVLTTAKKLLVARGIQHSTIQIESVGLNLNCNCHSLTTPICSPGSVGNSFLV